MENIARALIDSNWTVEILSPTPCEDESAGIQGVRYNEFNYTNPSSSVETMLNTVRGVGTYRKLMSKRDFDIVLDDISHYPYYPAHFLCPEGITNAVFMHTAFFGAAREYVGPIRGSVIDIIDRTLPWLNHPAIICAGESTRNRIHDITDYRNTRILHPMVQADEFTYTFDPESQNVLYLGRLDARKNVECLLRAWQYVERSTNCNMSLLIAGTGPREQELIEFASQLHLNNVEFLGYVGEKEKRRLFSNSLLYVLPSKMEGYVTTGLEAMASGTPVVGSDTFGINDYVKHAETGYLFPVDNHRHLAEILLELISTPEQLEPIAKAGRDLAEEHSFESFKQNANSLFQSLVMS
ncbi:glycosyltransferase family 4 protein [Salinigranum marinum]|uniref:glycosyltransferase family 4 protein n=1 Tax=Salinigranum marinum TaxID=1515595 RepID=UPI002989BA32|nr:glycosyltransferase family 4 protein [Salinigranum marinum]